MSAFFALEDSVFYKMGHLPAKTIATIANRYIGSNPASPFTFRAVSTESFLQMEDGRFDMNLNAKFPDSQHGVYGYAMASLYCESSTHADLSLSCYGPTRIYVNGSLVYKSTMDDDVSLHGQTPIRAQLQTGWNTFFVKMIKTASGFGCRFGTSNGKWFPLQFLSPFTARAGRGGWVYADPTPYDTYPEDQLPAHQDDERDTKIAWLPRLPTQFENSSFHDLQSVFGLQSGKFAYSWSALQIQSASEESTCRIMVSSPGRLKLWIDSTLILQCHQEEKEITLLLSRGMHQLLIESTCTDTDWSYTLVAAVGGNLCRFTVPADVKGCVSPWLYLGPLAESLHSHSPEYIQTLYRLFPGTKDAGGQASVYWRAGNKYVYVRPYLENELYAKWNYPLGVTLYGLLQAGKVLTRPDILTYVNDHILECTKLYEYALWDKEHYGTPAINHQLVELNMLDDCGSFGSAMLEACSLLPDDSFLHIAHIIADYIKNKQERKENSVFYRQRPGEYQENTLWADDLYMSTPFLCRYYRLTGKTEYINEAAKQFLLFKQYLFMPELNVMSHVYDFKYDTPTYVPWGRGNGWVIFSLSELLAVLPETHERRGELLSFFRELAEGYLQLQGSNGLWHQVLNDTSSYEETSCTAMFTYAFCRGIRYGWLEQPAPYANAVERAWNGITRYAVDKYGNVYGVCRGSGYSFSPLYYKDELNWVLNDTHGIGIVLLCGIEVMKLQAI